MTNIHGNECGPVNSSGSGLRFDFHLCTAPRLLWKAQVGKSYGEDRPLVEKGIVRTKDQEGHPIILDTATGALLGHQEASDVAELERSSVESEVLYSAGSESVTAVNANDGTTKWSHQLRHSYRNACLVVANNVVYVTGSGKAGFKRESSIIRGAEGYVLALDAITGDVLWMYTTGGEVWHAPVVANGCVYIGDGRQESRHVYCLSTTPRSRLGECLWRYKLSGLAEQGAVAGDTVYWGCYNGILYAIDARSGELRWRFQAGESVADKGPPCIIGDWVFVGSKDGYLYGLDARSGALRWKHFVVDDEAWEAEQREEAKRLSDQHDAIDDDKEEEDEDERREREEYEAESTPLDEKDEEEFGTDNSPLPSYLDLCAWAAEGRLYMLTTQGFLHCFELPEASTERRLVT